MKNMYAYSALTMAMVIAGSSVVIGKIIAMSFPVFLAAGLRFGIASAILLPALLCQEKGLLPVRKRDGAILLLQSFTGVFLFTLFLLYGLRLTNAAESGIITSTTPTVLGVISFLVLKERPTLSKVVGIGFTVLGMLAVNVSGASLRGDQGMFRLVGNLLIFGAVVGEAFFTVLGKMLSEEVSPLATATWVSVAGFLLFLPFAVYDACSFHFAALGLTEWMAMIYYGIVVTVIAFILWFQGIARVSAGTAAAFTGVMPVSAIVLAYLLLREPVSWAHIVGGVCVVIGIGFVTLEHRCEHVFCMQRVQRRKKTSRRA